jgi:hypothetical protein
MMGGGLPLATGRLLLLVTIDPVAVILSMFDLHISSP